MIALFFLSLLSLGAAAFSFKWVKNLVLRYFLVVVFLIIAVLPIWVLVVASRSGEM